MTPKQFYALFEQAEKGGDKDDFISWHEEPPEELENIWTAANMSPRDMVKKSGMTVTAFAIKYCIAKRTLDHWISGQNRMPTHTRFMLTKMLGILSVEN